MKWLLRKSVKCLARLLAASPWWMREALGAFLGFLWFDVLRLRRQVVLGNLRLAFPQWSEHQRVRCGRHSLQLLMKSVVDYALMPWFDQAQAQALFEVEGLEHWQQAHAQAQGVLLLGLHLGRGDLGICALSRMGLPIALISKEFKSRWLNDAWFSMRARHGTQLISFHKSHFDILRALKRGSGVIFVNDQFMGPPSGVATQFFGHPTGTAKGLAMIAERSGAPVVPIYTYALGKGRNRIVFEKPIAFQRQADQDRTIEYMTQVYTDKVEEIVKRYPQQWLWIHKRWKNFA